MNRCILIIILALLFCAGCKSYSKYAIDSEPNMGIDTNLLGMWRCVEDTDKTNFIEVQNTHDIYGDVEKRYGSMENYLAKSVEEWKEGAAQGKWDSTEDRSMLALRWDTRNKHSLYWITYFDAHGLNPHFEAWDAFLSSVNKKIFLNLTYLHQVTPGNLEEGYLLVRFIKLTRDTVTTAIVADKTLKNLKSSKAVRDRVTARLNDKNFYSDTMHFYRIKKFHGAYKIAVKLANPK